MDTRTLRRLIHLSLLLLIVSRAAADQPCKRPLPGAGSDPQAILAYSRCALSRGETADAIRMLGLLPKADTASHFQAGLLLAQSGAYSAAAQQFGMARRSSKDSYLAGYNQALAYVRAGNYQAAIDTANELLNQGHETAELADVAATAYLKSGHTQEAYNALRLATQLNPKDEDAYVDLCLITLDRERYDQGLQIASIGLSHLPHSSRLRLQRGVLHAMKGQFVQAQADFESAAELAPADPSPLIALGVVAIQTGNLDAALKDLRAAVRKHPDNYAAQYWLSQALLRAGAVPGSREGDEAKAALEASVRLNPNYWHARADLGKVMLDRGEIDPAIVELRKAAELNPKATEPLYLLAQAYRRKGDEPRAQELTSRVAQMQAEDREALSRSVLKGLGHAAAGAPDAAKAHP
jgi:tetratricopeptide (TPR) repeat protein